MPNNIRISISHADENHQFVFEPWCKKALLVLLAVLTTSVLAILGYLQYQSYISENTVKNMLARSSELSERLNASSQKRIQLEQFIDNSEETYTQIIEAKNNELSSLTRRVSSVEELLGLEKENAVSLSHRIDVAAINSAVRATMMQLIPNGKPIESFRRSSGYGSRTHPVTGEVTFHYGLDLTAKIGTPVYSSADGVIEYKRSSRGKTGYGNVLKVRHAFGFMTVYAHLDRFKVNMGQFVKKGELIGWSGNTGLSTGPHLHYEVRFLGKPLSPRNFIDWTPDNFDSLFKDEKKVKWTELVAVVENMAQMNVRLASNIESKDLDSTPLLADNSNKQAK